MLLPRSFSLDLVAVYGTNPSDLSLSFAPTPSLLTAHVPFPTSSSLDLLAVYGTSLFHKSVLLPPSLLAARLPFPRSSSLEQVEVHATNLSIKLSTSQINLSFSPLPAVCPRALP